MARESEYTMQGIGLPQDWRGVSVGAQAVAPTEFRRDGPVAPRDVAPPGASLAGDAVSLANGLSRLHEALTSLNDRLHGPRPRPAPDAGKNWVMFDTALRLTLDRALALVSACEAELAEAMQRL